MFLEVGNLNGLIPIILGMLFGPVVIFILVGLIFKHYNKKKIAKVFSLLALLYIIISFGTCGSLTRIMH